MANTATTHDSLFEGALQLYQPQKGHRAGTDGVLLSAMTPLKARQIVDLGASTGLVGLRAAQINPEAQVLLIERDGALVSLAQKNITFNSLSERANVLEADVFTLNQHPELRERFDCLLTNPPYFSHQNVRRSPDLARADAHVFAGGLEGLEGWLKAAATLTAPHGTCIMIHRAEEIAAILPTFTRRFGAATIRFVHPKAEDPAIRVVIAGIKGSRGPLSILPPLVLHEADGTFTPTAKKLHQGQLRLTPYT